MMPENGVAGPRPGSVPYAWPPLLFRFQLTTMSRPADIELNAHLAV